jgi:hypothetical protein
VLMNQEWWMRRGVDDGASLRLTSLRTIATKTGEEQLGDSEKSDDPSSLGPRLCRASFLRRRPWRLSKTLQDPIDDKAPTSYPSQTHPHYKSLRKQVQILTCKTEDDVN